MRRGVQLSILKNAEKYLNRAESDIERDLIEDTISTIRY